MRVVLTPMGRVENIVMPHGPVKQNFHVSPVTTREIEESTNLWWAMYVNKPPWMDDRVKPLGIPAAVCREIARPVLVEFLADITGGERADYLAEQFSVAQEHFLRDLELGLALGGVAFKPYVFGDKILVDATGANGFQPTRFDMAGQCVGGVFKSKPVPVDEKWYIRMEYHDFRDGVYTIQSKAFRSDENGAVADEVSLDIVPEWAELQPVVTVENLTGPLFAYYKNPILNNIDAGGQSGVSVYSGAAVELIRQADEQWADIMWEYRSGRRKIFIEGMGGLFENFDKDLFKKAPFSGQGDLFEIFSPAFRDDALYRGFQNTLKLIEYNTGLAYGDLSDPQAVERTATEIRSAKQRKYVTAESVKAALSHTFDALLYAMDAYSSIYGLAPPGEYEASFDWGDSVLDDEETKQARYADMRLDVAGGYIKPEIYLAKKYGVTEEEARAMMPGADELADEGQDEVE